MTTIGAGFSIPDGVAVDAKGFVFVGNGGDNSVQRIDPEGRVATVGKGFNRPEGVAADSKGDIYVADSGNNAVKEIFPNGRITTLGSTFDHPEGVAVSAGGEVFVANTRRNEVDKISATGKIVRIGHGFDRPSGVAVAANGTIYVADTLDRAVKMIAPNGNTTRLHHVFRRPAGVALDALGDVYVADPERGIVEEIATDGTVAVVGSPDLYSHPRSVAIGSGGSVYIADTGGDAVQKYEAVGSISTFVTGIQTPIFLTGDGAGNIYTLQADVGSITKIAPDGSSTMIGTDLPMPTALAVDPSGSGNIYLVGGSYYDPSSEVFCLAPDGTLTTIAKRLTNISPSIAVDLNKNVYIAAGENGNRIVETIAPNGTITPIGSGFTNATAVAIDQLGKLYVGDYTSVKVVATNGSIRTLATHLNGTWGITIGDSGIYILSQNKKPYIGIPNVIERISTDGGFPQVLVPAGAVGKAGIAIGQNQGIYFAAYDDYVNLIEDFSW